MCSIGEEPPPLVDPTKRKPKTLKTTGTGGASGSGGRSENINERDEEEFDHDEFEQWGDVDKLTGYFDNDGEFIWDDMDMEDEDSGEDEGSEEEGSEEEDDEEEEEEGLSYDTDEDEVCDPKAVCTHQVSDAHFQESDLENRKKRRYLVGVHSFLQLNDPELDLALEPAEEVQDDGECGAGYIEGEEVTRRTLKNEKAKYRDLCNKLGIKPDPKVLNGLRNPIMDLSNMGMNWKEIYAVCKVLETNTHVQWLSLAGNTAGKQGGMAIAELIKVNRTINTYILSATELLEAFEEICDAIAQNPTIVQLNFSKNDLEDMDMPGIRKILRGECPLQILNLNANIIRDPGLRNIGQGLFDNKTLEEFDLSHNKFLGEKKTINFFNACANHPELKYLSLRRNFLQDEGGKALGRVLYKNLKLEEIDLSFNLLNNATAAAIGRGINRKKLALKKLLIEFQRFREKQAAAILKPMSNAKLELPIELVDFGMMLDIHKDFISAKAKALKAYPDLKIINGQIYGLEHAKGPDHKALVIRKADAVCKSFETPLVMLMEELAKEKPVLTQKEFRKFIKQCNLYKDKTLTEAFEKVFEKEKEGGINGEAILEAFDKEYPGLRKIPDPDDEEEEMEAKPKKKKKKGKKGKGKGKKGKGKGKKGAGGGAKAAAAKKGGKKKKK